MANNKKKSKVMAKAKTNNKGAAKNKVGNKPTNEDTMDRAALKGLVSQLQGSGGVDIKVLKTDSEADLQKKVNAALQGLPKGDVLKTLEMVDPVKLVSVLKLDCIGVYIDLNDVSCVRCADAAQCASAFIKNVKGGMSHLKSAVSEPDDVAKKPTAAKPKLVPVTKYDHMRPVFVLDVPNPNPKGDDFHDTIQRVLDAQPETLGELRTIVSEDFDLDGDADFMEFVTALRDPVEGVLRLDVDLSEDNKAALRSAGYKI